jgi:hypothetical protein
LLPLAIVKKLFVVSSGKYVDPISVIKPKSELVEILYAVLAVYAAAEADKVA